MDKDDAKLGTYTCEVTELSREGETMIELEYRSVSWFPSKEYTLIIALPIVAITLFWAQVGFISEYSQNRVRGLHFLVSPSVMLVLLQFYRVTPGDGITAVLPVIQLLGYIVAAIGLYLCASACVAAHGPLLISGLIIIALVELFGLVYLIFMVPEI
ncbi:PREDICTED: leukocyte surface antigen CD47-like isoform X3 [Chinchilla lanigera]|uniref:leukocyte surface antigen CD47-like isoform X3 n=1 Tax=Chinchilla lanigera TaxID=34839 RepID=UPI00038EAF40|nr:PREDICTED: leukocyte surface antigen CD47-like isoform X3 [Chinchilla lanigera]